MKIRSARFWVSAFSRKDFPANELPEVALVGRSNVGKSSLINRLVGRTDLARTSSTPGRTRSINFYLINQEFYLVDLPGYGYAKLPEAVRRSWKKLADDYLTDRSRLACCLMIVDPRRQASPLDLQMADWLSHAKIPYLVVATKSDKLSANARNAALAVLKRSLAEIPVVAFSARSDQGREEVWRWVQTAASNVRTSKV